MSRSGYVDECDEQWMFALHRGRVASTIRGKKGQTARECLAAMDALPEKKLTANALEQDGSFCTMGTVGRARGLDMSKVDPEDPESVAALFGISDTLAREIAYLNDEGFARRKVTTSHGREYFLRIEGPEERWERMRRWVQSQIRQEAA